MNRDVEAKNVFLKWLYKQKVVSKEENVYRAARAFFANSLVRWCLMKKKKGEFSDEETDRYARLALRFVKKELDLWWNNGIINMRFNKEEETGHGSDRMEN